MTATQAFITLSPNQSGSAAFLAVPDGEANPANASQLLAYRAITFTNTNAELVQFALSLSAVQDESGAVTNDDGNMSNTVLQPSTAYNVLMYQDGESPKTIGSFTTLSSLDEGGRFSISPTTTTLALSEQNFATRTDGKYRVPFVVSWVVQNIPFLELSFLNSADSATVVPIITASSSGLTLRSRGISNGSSWGDVSRGGQFMHTPINSDGTYQTSLTSPLGYNWLIKYNRE